MASFQRQFGTAWTCIDERPNIGPHHLAIGKTRKLFEQGNLVEAFYSEGYRIGHARLDAETLELRELSALDQLPVAWGGGAFCVDNDDKGRISLGFVHRNRHEFCFVRGVASGDKIQWENWSVVAATSGPQAAPWVEVGPDGSAWCSVLSRDGDFRLAIVDSQGKSSVAPLFAPGEEPWYHSCVQVLPFGVDEAVAVGFRGQFPSKTELVFKTVSRGLELGPSLTLAPCNVNDQFTFHFQAVGDAARGRAHIVYLDDGLSVSHAVYEKSEWRVHRNVVPFPAYAPQICLDETGRLAFLTCDYEGVVWTASWSTEHGWSEPRHVDGLPANTISGLFGRTGYGTGGLISAARTRSGRVPFLMGMIIDEHTAAAKLYAGSLGRQRGLILDSDHPISLVADGTTLRGEIRLESLRKGDLERSGKLWTVSIPRASGAPARLAISSHQGSPIARLECGTGDGRHGAGATRIETSARFEDPFAQRGTAAAIGFEFRIPGDWSLRPEKAWAETYAVADRVSPVLADIAPFVPEAAAQTALAPHRIPVIYKRMV